MKFKLKNLFKTEEIKNFLSIYLKKMRSFFGNSVPNFLSFCKIKKKFVLFKSICLFITKNFVSSTTTLCRGVLALLQQLSFDDFDLSFDLNHESINKTQFQQMKNGPGIYIIHCRPKNKIYIGESANLLRRLGGHWHLLNVNRNDCHELQNDWNLHGSTSFDFIALSVGSQWRNESARKKVENELVLKNKDCVYNVSPEPKGRRDKFLRPVRFQNQSFASINEASRITNTPRTTLARKAHHCEDGWQFIEQNSEEKQVVHLNSAKPVIVNGVLYRSVRQAAAETQIHRTTLMRHLKETTQTYCYYVTEQMKNILKNFDFACWYVRSMGL